MPKSADSASIPLRCTTCGHRGRVTGSSPGQRVSCPVCDERLVVPTPPAASAGLTVTPPAPPPSSETRALTTEQADTAAFGHVLDSRD